MADRPGDDRVAIRERFFRARAEVRRFERKAAAHLPGGRRTVGIVRIVGGVIGPRPARFAGFIPGPRAGLGDPGRLAVGHAPRYPGHAPAGGATLPACSGPTAPARPGGWRPTAEAFRGVEPMAGRPEIPLPGAVALVVAGGIVESPRQREALGRAMPSGHRRRPSGPRG